MSETQHTVDSWATEAFGPGRPLAAFRRAEEEIREFIFLGDPRQDSDYHQPEFRSAIMEEAADVVITFYRLAAILGEDLHSWIDRKMTKNRARQWVAHGDGTGHHIKIPTSV